MMKSCIAVLAVIGAVLALMVNPRAADRGIRISIPYEVFGPRAYQSFIVNWNDKKTTTFRRLIRTTEEWSAVFHPAPTMDQTRPLGPDASLFETRQILVIARVTSAPAADEWDEILSVEDLYEQDGNLVLRYRYRPPKNKAGYTAKTFIALIIPKQEYKKLVLIESNNR